MTFKIGDIVKVIGIIGPDLVVGAIDGDSILCGWFNVHLDFVERIFAKRLLEPVRK